MALVGTSSRYVGSPDRDRARCRRVVPGDVQPDRDGFRRRVHRDSHVGNDRQSVGDEMGEREAQVNDRTVMKWVLLHGPTILIGGLLVALLVFIWGAA